MSMETRVFTFEGTNFNLPAETTPKQAQDLLGAYYPNIKNAEYEEKEDGSVLFTVKTGTKG